MKHELRYVDAQFEARTSGNEFKIAGYAAVFNSWSQDLGGFREQIAPGTFTKTISESDVRALWNHDSNYVLGRNKAGTLQMAEDSTGLNYEVTLADTQTSRDFYETIKRGDVSQSSFAFDTIEDSWNFENDPSERTLKEVQLFDVSPVTYPAYQDASIGTRALERLEEAKRQLEQQREARSLYIARRHVPADIIRIKGAIK